MSYLVLIRHGESVWNAKGLWTGLTDVPLTNKGREQGRQIAQIIKNIKFDLAFTSPLVRAKQTLEEIIKVLGVSFRIIEDPALNERDYGQFTGQNKWDIKKQLGEENFLKIRRSFDYPIAGGETLKDVYDRVVPYYLKNILPNLQRRKNVLMVAHGNSLRALIKYLENIEDQQIPYLELAIGAVYIYQMDDKGRVLSKKVEAITHDVP